MTEKDYMPCLVAGVKRARLRFSPLPAIRYETKVLNLKTQEIGLLICTWKNKFADAEIDFATCVDRQGKRYNIELDNIRGFEDDFEK